MAQLLDALFRLTAEMVEASLSVTNATLRSMQSAVDKIAGRETPYYPAAPPVEGPQTVDLATADLANRLGWILWTTPLDARELPWILQGAMTSVQRSFAGLDWSDPKQWLTLPFDLPLSLATLLTEQGLRALHTAEVVGPGQFLPFAAYMADSFADIHVFVSLQYEGICRLSPRPHAPGARRCPVPHQAGTDLHEAWTLQGGGTRVRDRCTHSGVSR